MHKAKLCVQCQKYGKCRVKSKFYQLVQQLWWWWCQKLWRGQKEGTDILKEKQKLKFKTFHLACVKTVSSFQLHNWVKIMTLEGTKVVWIVPFFRQFNCCFIVLLYCYYFFLVSTRRANYVRRKLPVNFGCLSARHINKTIKHNFTVGSS